MVVVRVGSIVWVELNDVLDHEGSLGWVGYVVGGLDGCIVGAGVCVGHISTVLSCFFCGLLICPPDWILWQVVVSKFLSNHFGTEKRRSGTPFLQIVRKWKTNHRGRMIGVEDFQFPHQPSRVGDSCFG